MQGPTTTHEYHEYRSYTSNGGSHPGEFSLERQVEHMMPQGSFTSSTTTTNNNNVYKPISSGLQSANMVSSMQQQKQQQNYTSYKVQSNKYNSAGERINYDQHDLDRPGSRLKQNIDELDTLLYDLNNARKISDAGADYTASSITPGNMSSDDYSFSEGHPGQVKRTMHSSYNEMSSYQTSGGGGIGGKPPSPSPRRRNPSQPLSSPTSVRRVSPGPSTTTSKKNEQLSSSSYKYTSSYQREYTSDLPTTYSPTVTPSKPISYSSTSYSPEVPKTNGTPTGVSYYTKYHSTHSHQSQDRSVPASPFPSNSLPRSSPRTQAPPKRVDDLMTELSEFDSSIQHTTGFVEPVEPRPTTYRDHPSPRPYREPSPVRPTKQQSTPGPAVYYPPGEMFSGTKVRSEAVPVSTVQQSSSLEVGGGRGKAKGEYAYKAKEKSKHSESEGKQGAAVVPICLPLCCAAPCVIM